MSDGYDIRWFGQFCGTFGDGIQIVGAWYSVFAAAACVLRNLWSLERRVCGTEGVTREARKNNQKNVVVPDVIINL